MLDQLLGSFSFFNLIHFFSYFSATIFLITLFSYFFIKIHPVQFEALKRGNISVSLLFSAYVLSIGLNTGIISNSGFHFIPFFLLALLSNIVITAFYLSIKSLMSDYFDEIFLNNNLSISILFSIFLIVLGFSSSLSVI